MMAHHNTDYYGDCGTQDMYSAATFWQCGGAWLGLHIWDYSSLPFNLLGQICLPFTVLWFFLALLCIFVDDWLRHILFHEERPHYHWNAVCDGGKHT